MGVVLHTPDESEINALIAAAVSDLGLDAVFNGITSFNVDGDGNLLVVKDGDPYFVPLQAGTPP